MNKEDLIEEMYNEVIQEESQLQYKYSGDELHEKIMEIVEIKLDYIDKLKKLKKINNHEE